MQARPIFKDSTRHEELADPLLRRRYPVRGFQQAVAVAAMCLHEEPKARPSISDVVTALTYLAPTDDPSPPSPPPPPPPILLHRDAVAQRQRALAEAIKWGSASRNNPPLRIHTPAT